MLQKITEEEKTASAGEQEERNKEDEVHSS